MFVKKSQQLSLMTMVSLGASLGLTGALTAQDITLISPANQTRIQGTLVDFDGAFYRLATNDGEVTAPVDAFLCEGAACPVETVERTWTAGETGGLVSLALKDGSATLTGTALSFDAETLTVATQVGDVAVRIEDAICVGAGCPQLAETVVYVLPAPLNTDASKTAKSELVDAMEEVAAGDENIALTTDEAGEPDGLVMLADVMFDYNATTLSDEGLATLAKVVAKLPKVERLEVVGHTDSKGSAAYNMHLGQERADAVLNWLEARGYIEKGSVRAKSAGEYEPIAKNHLENGADYPQGRAMNRRVEFRILK